MPKKETPPQGEDKDQEARRFVLPDLAKDLLAHEESDPDMEETSLELKPLQIDTSFMRFPDEPPTFIQEEDDDG